MQTKWLLIAVLGVGCTAQTAGVDGDAGAPPEVKTDSGTQPPGPTNDATAANDAAPANDASPANDAGTTPSQAPAGWLYTQGNKVYVSNGTSGTVWVGRGVNADDLFLCGYNNSLWMTNAESTLTTMTTKAVADWNAKFVRVSLSMNSFPSTVSWTSGNAATYKTPMTNVINALGAKPNTYVLVTLRSDSTMSNYGDDATNLPANATDTTYRALVDTFANSSFVLFGLANEPGGNKLSNATIRAAMDHAVGVIRAEEDKLGVPHHIVSVQGNNWTSDIGFYAQNPLTGDNGVYEVHGYPPPASSYTYSNIPVILGEYGSLTNASAFFADIEAKQIPTLAWDFDSYSNCAPDLVAINQSASNLVPTSWGTTVKTYLAAH